MNETGLRRRETSLCVTEVDRASLARIGVAVAAADALVLCVVQVAVTVTFARNLPPGLLVTLLGALPIAALVGGVLAWPLALGAAELINHAAARGWRLTVTFASQGNTRQLVHLNGFEWATWCACAASPLLLGLALLLLVTRPEKLVLVPLVLLATWLAALVQAGMFNLLGDRGGGLRARVTTLGKVWQIEQLVPPSISTLVLAHLPLLWLQLAVGAVAVAQAPTAEMRAFQWTRLLSNALAILACPVAVWAYNATATRWGGVELRMGDAAF